MQFESATKTTVCIFEQSDDGFVRKGGQKNKSLAPTISGFETDIVVSLFCTD
jgi:hypothetical protein